MVEKIIKDSRICPTSSLELLLCLCALNLLNAWVKREEYKSQLYPWDIKIQVSMLVKYLLEAGTDFMEEVKYNIDNKCMYIRCLGLQFSFHYVNLDNLTNEQRDAIIVNDNIWDGVRLQDVAEKLYCEASASITNQLGVDEIKEKLSKILLHG